MWIFFVLVIGILIMVISLATNIRNNDIFLGVGLFISGISIIISFLHIKEYQYFEVKNHKIVVGENAIYIETEHGDFTLTGFKDRKILSAKKIQVKKSINHWNSKIYLNELVYE